MMLHRMAFCLSGKVVALHLDNSTAKAYLCNQGGTVYPYLSRLACQILSLTDKHGITLIPAYIPTHLNEEADYLSWDRSGIFSLRRLRQPLGPSRGVPAGIFSFYSMPALLHLGNSTTSGGLVVECFQPSLDFQVSYVFPPPALVPLVLSKLLAEHVNGQFRHLILVMPCWMEAPWLPTVPNMLADIPG